MITLRLDFKCILCQQSKNWYIMPFDEQTPSKDYVHSVNKFRLACKGCGNNYKLSFKIEELKRGK